MKIENASQVVTASYFYKRSHLCVCGGSGVGRGGGRGESGGRREIRKLEVHRTKFGGVYGEGLDDKTRRKCDEK